VILDRFQALDFVQCVDRRRRRSHSVAILLLVPHHDHRSLVVSSDKVHRWRGWQKRRGMVDIRNQLWGIQHVLLHGMVPRQGE